MSRRRAEPLVWLMFSAGGVTAAVFLPVLAFLFGLAIPLGWVSTPSHHRMTSMLSFPLVAVVLLGMTVVMLVHAAHRFRFTLYDGLQLKFRRTVAATCYGGALLGSIAAVAILLSVS